MRKAFACVVLLAGPAAAACAPEIPAERIVSDPRFYAEGSSDIILRQLCVALAARKPDPCDVLEKIPGEPENGMRMCRRLFEQSLLAAKLMSGAPRAQLSSACARWCNTNPVPPPAELVAKVCPLLIARDVDGACADVAHWRGHGYSKQKCTWEFHSLLGDGDVCRHWPRPASDVCDSTAAFGRSKKSGGSCGGDPICRALSGEGAAACAPLDARLRELSCAKP